MRLVLTFSSVTIGIISRDTLVFVVVFVVVIITVVVIVISRSSSDSSSSSSKITMTILTGDISSKQLLDHLVNLITQREVMDVIRVTHLIDGLLLLLRIVAGVLL